MSIIPVGMQGIRNTTGSFREERTPLKNFKDRRFLLDHPELVVIDVRYVMGAPDQGRVEYLASHYPGAAYLHLDEDLAGPVGSHGGRHPLPDRALFQEKLRAIGLSNHSRVLIYDHGDNGPAGRLWWMLKHYGLKDVYVLEGGFPMLLGEDLTDAPSTFSTGDVTLQPVSAMLASYEEVLALAMDGGDGGRVLLDARSPERYLGWEEPIDPKAGHIPHARNVHFRIHFREDNTLKDRTVLQKIFDAATQGASDIINQCGSGVTACTNILVLDELGIASRLYVGSFSDYASYPENRVMGE